MGQHLKSLIMFDILLFSLYVLKKYMGVENDGDTVVFGEVGLAGEIRAVAQAEQRLKEAAKLGFKHGIAPTGKGRKALPDKIESLSVLKMDSLADLLTMLGRPGTTAKEHKTAD